MNRADARHPASTGRRGFLRRLVVGALGVAGGAAVLAPADALAQPRRSERGRGLDPDERDRLRRDLRERGFDGWQRREAAPDPRQDPRRREPSYGTPGRLSDDERQQLRRQLREAGRRRN
ncbi:hypothetical protein [Zeimonas arvi]|uniref:Uncharacterized protein n=1 Tax=Zeimonas arvi TaxID=2498847 RepID=A0A5C8P1R2_9BURK|nr:hypothetical protein [Zeimonas arvi]TXL67196.1 hypothetical protein FHP08_06190 [Zeimonas arvi]